MNTFGFVSLGKSVQVGLSKGTSLSHRGEGVVIMLYPEEDEFDIDVTYEQIRAKGVPIVEELKTEYWGDRVFSVKDPDGYYLTFGKTVETVPMDEIQERMRNLPDEG